MGAARGRLCPPLQRVAQQWVASLYCVETQRERRSVHRRRGRRFIRIGTVNFPGNRNIGRRRFGRYLGRLRRQPATPNAQPTVQQRRLAATEPGNIDRGIIPRGLAHQQIAPDFHGCLGLLDILEEGDFAVKAAPAAGLEQLSQILQPLLGKSAPARDNIAATFHVESMCHEPARKEKNGRGTQRGTNQFDATFIFCGKLLPCPAGDLARRPGIDRRP